MSLPLPVVDDSQLGKETHVLIQVQDIDLAGKLWSDFSQRYQLRQRRSIALCFKWGDYFSFTDARRDCPSSTRERRVRVGLRPNRRGGLLVLESFIDMVLVEHGLKQGRLKRSTLAIT